MRKPCPYCGGTFIGVGWGDEPVRNKDGTLEAKEWCSVICRKCSARGPFCATEDEAWAGWNERASLVKGKG